jgi:hypothetical protein
MLMWPVGQFRSRGDDRGPFFGGGGGGRGRGGRSRSRSRERGNNRRFDGHHDNFDGDRRRHTGRRNRDDVPSAPPQRCVAATHHVLNL